MVRKKLVVAIATIGALQAGFVSALGMGDFSLKSALNQPLNAEIKLSNIADLDESQVLVKMADSAAFSNAGVSRDFFLTNIKFNVEVDGKGGGIIRVTTREPVVEPYLNFLVEARWPSGRMLREFTVLLDLPVFSDNVASSVEKPVSNASVSSVSSVSTSVVKTQPQVSARQPVVARQTQPEAELEAGEQYRVKNDDTLWDIAQKSRPSGDVSLQQTMVGIQRLNPQAFVNGNINRLKAGSVIRLPTRDQISISERQAIGEVAKHNRAWKQGDDSLISTADVQLDATSSDDASGESYSEGARLSIASSGESDNSGFADGEGSDSNGGSALNDALASAQEDLDKTTMENQELQSRLSDMEAKLATMQRLIELKDDQLAAIQADGAVDNNVDTDVEAVDQQILAEDSSVDNQVADLTAEQQAEEVTVAEDKPEVSVEAEPAKAPEESLLDQLKNNPMYAGGAGLFILAIAALLLMRKRKDKQEEEQDDLFDEPEIGAFKEFDEPAEEDEAQPLEDVVEEDSTDQLVAELESQIAADNAKEEAEVAESPVAESTSVESETGDVIAEADIYVAYGRYQQAIDLLRTAAEQEPERTDVQLKLLEVYVETRDKPAFQQQYKVLAGLGNASAIEQVKEMLSTVDGVSDWLDGISDDSSSFTDEDMDADLIEGEAVAEPSIEMDDVSLDLDEDLELDDDLDLDLDEAASEDLELDLDSELDLDELNDESIEQLSDTDIEAQLDEDDAFNLDEDLSLDETSDSDDFDADKTTMFTASDLQAEMDETVVDSLDEDLDLDDLSVETEEDSATVGESNLDEGFDLDLDDDMDLGALDDTDLGELESEFGDTNSEPESLGESDEFIADDLDQEFDLDELSDSVSELDAEPSEDDEFDLDLVSSEDSDTTAEYSLDEATAGLATAGLATAGAVAASDQQELSDIVDSDDAVSDDDFDFLADTDEVATKLDLARAYIDMGDTEGAKDILDEVLAEGDEQQIQEANSLVEKMD